MFNVSSTATLWRRSIGCAIIAVNGARGAEETTVNTSAKGTPVEVVFVLDTTGSMGGLIAGAKEKIWYMANNIVQQNQGAPIKMGLLAYRDRGDEYITRRYDLTSDLDTAYAHLTSFVAAGGGDGPESVNQALYEAVNTMAWSDNPKTLRLIFLVGDYPPHMDYDDDVQYPLSCEAARKKGIIINTVQCGNVAATTPVWKEIAQRTEGAYAAISQDGGMRTIDTPYDKEIARISAELDLTVIPFGSRAEQETLRKNIGVARAASLAVQADRQMLNSSSKGRVTQGSHDLLQEIVEGNTKLNDIAADKLPDTMKGMSETEREAYVENLKQKRNALNQQLAKLSVKRLEYIAAETANDKKGAEQSFDEKVSAIIKSQLARSSSM